MVNTNIVVFGSISILIIILIMCVIIWFIIINTSKSSTTPTITPTLTPTLTPKLIFTPSPTLTPTLTQTFTPSPTLTQTFTSLPTLTPTFIPTPSPTINTCVFDVNNKLIIDAITKYYNNTFSGIFKITQVNAMTTINDTTCKGDFNILRISDNVATRDIRTFNFNKIQDTTTGLCIWVVSSMGDSDTGITMPDQCVLNCNSDKIKKNIKSYYETKSEFKNMYLMNPIYEQKVNDNTCDIFYSYKPNPLSPDITDSGKDRRRFTLNRTDCTNWDVTKQDVDGSGITVPDSCQNINCSDDTIKELILTKLKTVYPNTIQLGIIDSKTSGNDTCDVKYNYSYGSSAGADSKRFTFNQDDNCNWTLSNYGNIPQYSPTCILDCSDPNIINSMQRIYDDYYYSWSNKRTNPTVYDSVKYDKNTCYAKFNSSDSNVNNTIRKFGFNSNVDTTTNKCSWSGTRKGDASGESSMPTFCGLDCNNTNVKKLVKTYYDNNSNFTMDNNTINGKNVNGTTCDMFYVYRPKSYAPVPSNSSYNVGDPNTANQDKRRFNLVTDNDCNWSVSSMMNANSGTSAPGCYIDCNNPQIKSTVQSYKRADSEVQINQINDSTCKNMYVNYDNSTGQNTQFNRTATFKFDNACNWTLDTVNDGDIITYNQSDDF
jgi:hypothetical protein